MTTEAPHKDPMTADRLLPEEISNPKTGEISNLKTGETGARPVTEIMAKAGERDQVHPGEIDQEMTVKDIKVRFVPSYLQ